VQSKTIQLFLAASLAATLGACAEADKPKTGDASPKTDATVVPTTGTTATPKTGATASPKGEEGGEGGEG
jgi:ABC-type uncharacterized transport system auxiliary subunit